MELHKLEDFVKGWVIGDFLPSLYVNQYVEVGIKFFKKGSVEEAHKQLIATEITVVIEGKVRLGSRICESGDIILIPPNEVVDFESLTESKLVCIKFPSIPIDKVISR